MYVKIVWYSSPIFGISIQLYSLDNGSPLLNMIIFLNLFVHLIHPLSRITTIMYNNIYSLLHIIIP